MKNTFFKTLILTAGITMAFIGNIGQVDLWH
jgi:hypothetical protein